jgi:hypothetical protein
MSPKNTTKTSNNKYKKFKINKNPAGKKSKKKIPKVPIIKNSQKLKN